MWLGRSAWDVRIEHREQGLGVSDAPVGPVLAARHMRVPMRDIDQAGIIYFGNVYAWHEGLFTSWLAEIGHPLSVLLPRGEAMATVASRAEYRLPLRLDDQIRLELVPGKIGRSSFVLRTVVRLVGQTDEAIVTESTHVWTALTPDSDTGQQILKSIPVPDWLNTALQGPAGDPPLV